MARVTERLCRFAVGFRRANGDGANGDGANGDGGDGRSGETGAEIGPPLPRLSRSPASRRRPVRLWCVAVPAALLASFAIGDLPGMVVNILYVALGLGLVIFFHELGHFAVAKWCGVFVERFSIGFGPILWSRKWGDTEYALSAVPFGGYVKMLGQDDMDPSQLTSDEIAQDPRSYSAKPVWQRMAIIAAGVTMNIITAVLFFAAAYGLGVTVGEPVIEVAPGSAAWRAGLKSGDRITAINGRRVKEFNDLVTGVALSSGPVLLEGVHGDGTTFDLSIKPDTTGTRRSLGLGYTFAPEIGTLADGGRPVVPGTPASQAKPPLESRDAITAVDGLPVETFTELATAFARHRTEPVTLTLRRPVKEGEAKTLTSTIPANPVRDLGLRVEIGKIVAVVDGSPAAAAGMKAGDKITRVDGRDVGGQIDPLRLPYYFGDRAGQPVLIDVSREGSGDPQTLSLTVTPDDRPGWTEQPHDSGQPLTVPAIGIAYHLLPRVLAVTPGGPADKAGIKPNDQIDEVILTRAAGAPAEPGTTEKDEIVIDLEMVVDGKTVQNFGYAFTTIQRFPTRSVTLAVRSGEGTRRVAVKTWNDPADPWYFPTRGFVPAPLRSTLQAGSPAEALRLGVDRTRDSVTELYLTLRNLITGDLSVEELRGPLGIAGIAYAVVKEGFSQLLKFLGFLSVNLAVLNFLPIPVLDGGHMVFLLWEAVTRRKPSERVVAAATYVGLSFILLLMGTVMYLDLFVHRVLSGG